MGSSGGAVVMDDEGVDGRGKGQNLGVYGGNGGEDFQLSLVGYEKPAQDRLVVVVSWLVDRFRGLFLVVYLYENDEGGNTFGDGSSACVHKGGDEERRDGDTVSVAIDGGVQGFVDAGGVGDGCKRRPREYLVV